MFDPKSAGTSAGKSAAHPGCLSQSLGAISEDGLHRQGTPGSPYRWPQRDPVRIRIDVICIPICDCVTHRDIM